jgi:hypothetical protein
MLTFLMHQMHISTTQVSSVMLRSKKLEKCIVFVKNGLKKKIVEKTHENYLRSNHDEVCTALARRFRIILYVLVLEHVNLSSDK